MKSKFLNLNIKNYFKIENLKFKINDLIAGKAQLLILILIITIGAFFRFYKLDWGQGLFAHPDEYHIVISVNQLSFPTQMHPHFFSYGTVTIYLIYFTKTILENINSLLHSSFLVPNSFLIGRFYSALFSTLTIPLIYLITLTITNKKFALLAAFLTATTAGLIQQAHYTTPESNFIFFLLGSLLFLSNLTQTKRLYWLFLAAIFWGLALGVKVSTIAFAPVFFIALMISFWPRWPRIVLFGLLAFITATVVFFLGAPYVFLDFPHFLSSFIYESGLAQGKFLVFYTRQFMGTVPILFQLEKIYPFALGLPLLLFGILGLFLMMVNVVIKRHQISLNTYYIILITAFLSLFLPNAFLFAKWTRFIAPTFPFFAIFAAYFLYQLKSLMSLKQLKLPLIILYSLFFILNFLWALAFFSIYTHPDARITANSWIKANLPISSTIVYEEGNTVEVPIGQGFNKKPINFYNLEEDPSIQTRLIQSLQEADYFIVESRRVFANHQRLPQLFPKTASFYDNLFAGKAGFEEVKQFSSYPFLQLGPLKWEVPDERAEETWSVFDHPVIRIFQKTKQLALEDYAKLLEK